MRVSREVRDALAVIDRAYNRQSWHGTNLRGAIRGVSARQAAWRPSRKRHNIWEIVVHAAYWKYAVWRRLAGARRGSFPLAGSDWFVRPDHSTEAAWRADIALLDRMHAALRLEVSRLVPSSLRKTRRGSSFSHAELVIGIAAHDLYHAGQIQLLKKLRH
jgi:hypothetical protein